MVLDRQRYARLQDGAEFSVKQEVDGTWSIYYYKGEGEKIAVLKYFLSEDVTEAILARLAQVDIDAHAKYLFEFQPGEEKSPDQKDASVITAKTKTGRDKRHVD